MTWGIHNIININLNPFVIHKSFNKDLKLRHIESKYSVFFYVRLFFTNSALITMPIWLHTMCFHKQNPQKAQHTLNSHSFATAQHPVERLSGLRKQTKSKNTPPYTCSIVYVWSMATQRNSAPQERVAPLFGSQMLSTTTYAAKSNNYSNKTALSLTSCAVSESLKV